MTFKKAERRQAKARVALSGPSGSGKSMSALLMAKGLCPSGRIAAIDTERGSLSLYSHLLDFDVCSLSPPYTPERYIALIEEAEKAGYGLIIVDSLTHEWQGMGGLLEEHDLISRKSGNSYAAWGQITPRHQRLIDTMLQSSCHIIATIRSKTEYLQAQDSAGKAKIQKVGMAPQQRDGIDYEFTVVFDLSIDHVANASKDRTSLFDAKYALLTEKHGVMLREWLESGAEPADAPMTANGGPPGYIAPPATERGQVVIAIQGYWRKRQVTEPGFANPITRWASIRKHFPAVDETSAPSRGIREWFAGATLEDLHTYRKHLYSVTSAVHEQAGGEVAQVIQEQAEEE